MTCGMMAKTLHMPNELQCYFTGHGVADRFWNEEYDNTNVFNFEECDESYFPLYDPLYNHYTTD